MAYNNPILSAVLGRQQADMQNKQFEASLGLQIAQQRSQVAQKEIENKQFESELAFKLKQLTSNSEFQEKQAATQKNQFNRTLAADYTKLGEGARQFNASTNLRDSQTAQANASALSSTATAGKTKQQTADLVQKDLDAKILKLSPGYINDFTTNGEPMSAEALFSDPGKMNSYVAMLNSDGVRQSLFLGSNNEDYFVKNILDLGDGRQSIELFDPKNPDKQMFLSKYRTAEEGDPISAGSINGFGILKNQIDSAFFGAANMPLPKAAKEMAQTIAEITGTNVGALNNQTVNAAFEVGAQIDSQTQEKPEQQQTDEAATDVERVKPAVMHPAGGGEMLKTADGNTFGTVGGSSPTMLPIDKSLRNRDQMKAKSENKKTVNSALSDINTMEDVNFFDPEFLSQIPQSQINEEIKKREKLKQKIRPKATGLGKKKLTLTDEQAAERKQYDIAIDALSQLRDGPTFGLNTGQQKAVTSAVKNESMPASFIGTPKEKAVDAQIAAAAPQTPLGKKKVANQIGNGLKPSPGKISGNNLFQMKRLMNYGFLDADSAQRVFDLGVFSNDAVDIIKENISQQGQTERAGMKTETNNGITSFFNSTGVYAQVNTDLSGNLGLSVTEINSIVDTYQDSVAKGEVEPAFDNLFTKYQLDQTGYASQPAVVKGLLNNAANEIIHKKADISFMSDPYDWSIGGGSAPAQGATSLNRIVKTTDGRVFTVDRYGRRTNDRDLRLRDFSPAIQTMIETSPHNTLDQARNTIMMERIEALNQVTKNAGNDAEVKAYVDAELMRMEQEEIAKGQ